MLCSGLITAASPASSKPLTLGRGISGHQHNDEAEETEARSPISADPVRTGVKNKLHLIISN